MDPTLDEILRLSGELQALSGSFARAGAALQGECEGADPRQAVFVVLDKSGRVATVRPSALWAKRIQPEELGDAVLQAVQMASALRLERWADAGRSEAPALPPAQPEPRAWVGPAVNMMALLDDLATTFDAIGRAAEQVSAPPNALPEEAPRGDVTVVLSALGEPAGVRVDPDWARRTNLSRLSERLLEAFQQAYEDYDSNAGATRPTAIELSPEMKAVAADPGGALLRYVESLRSSLT